jgi:hypothetical protein
MSKRLKTYIVTVEVRTIELYQVEAESPDDAMELWQDGKLVEHDLSNLEADAIRAKEKGA